MPTETIPRKLYPRDHNQKTILRKPYQPDNFTHTIPRRPYTTETIPRRPYYADHTKQTILLLADYNTETILFIPRRPSHADHTTEKIPRYAYQDAIPEPVTDSSDRISEWDGNRVEYDAEDSDYDLGHPQSVRLDMAIRGLCSRWRWRLAVHRG